MQGFFTGEEALFVWLWRSSWQAAVLIGLVLLVQWPGCVAMLAHRCNMPTTIVGYQFSPQTVRGSVAPRATVHRNFEREPFILILV